MEKTGARSVLAESDVVADDDSLEESGEDESPEEDSEEDSEDEPSSEEEQHYDNPLWRQQSSTKGGKQGSIHSRAHDVLSDWSKMSKDHPLNQPTGLNPLQVPSMMSGLHDKSKLGDETLSQLAHQYALSKQGTQMTGQQSSARSGLPRIKSRIGDETLSILSKQFAGSSDHEKAGPLSRK
jgi:hypothetical protein